MSEKSQTTPLPSPPLCRGGDGWLPLFLRCCSSSSWLHRRKAVKRITKGLGIALATRSRRGLTYEVAIESLKRRPVDLAESSTPQVSLAAAPKPAVTGAERTHPWNTNDASGLGTRERDRETAPEPCGGASDESLGDWASD